MNPARLLGGWLALVLCAVAAAQPVSGAAPVTSVIQPPAAAASAPAAPAAGAIEAEADEDEEPTAAQRADPWEPFNRVMFEVNQELDQGLLTPLASAYVGLVPELVRTGIGNAFANAEDLWSAVNNLLQGKLQRSAEMTMRFVTNSTFGVFGLIDIAGAVGMERSPEDFGQTLGRWGMPPGPYMVLPFFGPSTVRDTIGLPLDLAASPAYAVNQGSFRPLTTGLQILNTRAELLPASEALDAMALDKYNFVRSVYLHRRLNQVFDGNPPEGDDTDGPPVPGAPR